MEVKIEKMDHLGRGICFINEKVCFVPFVNTNDIVKIEIIKDKKNYMEGKVIEVIKANRQKPFCPYFSLCGGCQLQYMTYDESIAYKKNRVINILRDFNIVDVEFVKNENKLYYRNKIELKIKEGKLGFYEEKSHNIIEINECMITKKSINNFLKEIKKMRLTNADVILRANYNDELLIVINSKDTPILDEMVYPGYKVVGIILNDQSIYGENHYMEKVGNFFFEVSYDSFFQINSYINEKIFTILSKHVLGKKVLDLYCGVGTLGISCAKSSEEVYGIEIVPNAIVNAYKNAKINNIHNIQFLLGDAKEKIKFIQNDIDTIIVDPPRKGLDDFVIYKIREIKPESIIYISCDTQSLVRDLNKLKDIYNINKVYAFDMFSYTYHTEVMCILNRK